MAHINPSQLLDFENAERRRHPAILGEAPSSEQLGPERLDLIYLKQLIESAKGSQYIGLEQAYLALRDQLMLLKNVGSDWDTYGAPAPSEDSIDTAGLALNALRASNAQPSAVVPSADGGIGICFMRDDSYAHIEFSNDGSAYGMMYAAGKNPQNWQLESVDADNVRNAWKRISAYLQS
jgi:hypothetical protein